MFRPTWRIVDPSTSYTISGKELIDIISVDGGKSLMGYSHAGREALALMRLNE